MHQTLAQVLFHFATVLAPAVAAGLALRRLIASRSRNRLIYGAYFLVAGLLAVRVLADSLAGLPLDAFIALAALASPVGWGIILWVVSPPGQGLYGTGKGRWPVAPPPLPERAAPRAAEPLLLKEAARVRRKAERTGERRTGVDPEASSPRDDGPWRPAVPLAFIPGAGTRS